MQGSFPFRIKVDNFDRSSCERIFSISPLFYWNPFSFFFFSFFFLSNPLFFTMLSMARFLPRPSVAIRLFSSTTPLSRNTIPPKTKKGLVLRASEVAAACGLNPFVHPAELVKTHWVRTCPNHYKGMAEWAAESYDLPESQDEMAERLTQSTSSTQEITRIALESTRDADDTSILHQASKRMEEELESVSEPSKSDKEMVVRRLSQNFEELAAGVKEKLENSNMAPEEKESAQRVVEESIQTTISGIEKEVGDLSSASAEPKAELHKALQQSIEEKQQNLTHLVDSLSSPSEEDKTELNTILDSRFAQTKESLQLEVAGLRPALSDEDKQVISQHYRSTINKGFGVKHEHSALDAFERDAQMKVGSRNDQWRSRIIGKTRGRWVIVGGKVDGIAGDDTVVEVKNRISGFKDPLPVYDIVQLQTYLFITKLRKGGLVEQFKYDKSETKSTIIEWDGDAWYQTIRPRVARFSNAFEAFLDDEVTQLRFLRARDPEKEKIFEELLQEASSEFR